MLIQSINRSLNELIDLLKQLSNSEYSNFCADLSGASVGKHTRHIIEMFQCLENQYDFGVINYDNRNRNLQIENDTLFAIQNIKNIQDILYKENKTLELRQSIGGEEIIIQSNYFRELIYNFEHCIHHQALIKVAILKFDHVLVDDNFGVAHSTIEYRNKCVQ